MSEHAQAAVPAAAGARKAEIVEVKVVRRWVGSAVNPEETCGIPRGLAESLAAIPDSQGGPAVQILRNGAAVRPTEGIGQDGKIGSDKATNQIDTLVSLVGALLEEIQQSRGTKAKS